MNSDDRPMWKLIWTTMRPHQWVKNVFILAPALFTLKVLELDQWPRLIGGLAGFSFIASAIYAFNDIVNRDEDSRHPIKRNRPIASGKLSVTAGYSLSAVMFVLGIAIFLMLNTKAIYAAIGYIVLMFFYTLIFRELMIVDIIAVSVGFVIRVYSGALLISEPASHWLLLCTFTVALFLTLIKRRQELEGSTSADTTGTRSVLLNYPGREIIDSWISVLAGMTILCYALYTVDPITIAKHHSGNLIFTVPYVLYGIFRYQQLAVSGGASAEDPTKIVTGDPGIRITVFLWAITVGLILYTARSAL